MSWSDTQIIAVKFYDPADSEVVNRIGISCRPVGIYEGGYLTKVDNATVTLSTLQCEIGDTVSGEYHQVHVETTETTNVTVGSSTPYVVLRWEYAESTSNYMTVHAVALGSIEAGDVIVGKCLYSGSTLTGFDYGYDETNRIYNRTNPLTMTKFLKVEPTSPASMYVRVKGGWCNFGSQTYDIDDQIILMTAPGSLSKVYLVYVHTDGTVMIDSSGTASSSPTAPSYGGKLVLAEVTISAGATSITASNIKDVRSFIVSSKSTNYKAILAPDLLVVNNTVSPDTKLDITASNVDVEGVEGTSVSVSVDFTTTGANGLDTGSMSASTWYHVYLISNGTTIAGLASTSSTSPTMPSGYTKKRWVACYYSDSSTHLRKTRVNSDGWHFYVGGGITNTGSTGSSLTFQNNGVEIFRSTTIDSGSWRSFSMASAIPSGCIEIDIVQHGGPGHGGACAVGYDGTYACMCSYMHWSGEWASSEPHGSVEERIPWNGGQTLYVTYQNIYPPLQQAANQGAYVRGYRLRK